MHALLVLLVLHVLLVLLVLLVLVACEKKVGLLNAAAALDKSVPMELDGKFLAHTKDASGNPTTCKLLW